MRKDILKQFIFSSKIEGWNLSTTTYDNLSFSVSTQTITPRSIFIKPDGTKLYLAGENENRIFQYTLSTPWDISTTVYDNISFFRAADVLDVDFNNDGSKMYAFAFGTSKSVFQYTLTTPWNISSAVTDNKSLDTRITEGAINSIFFKPDGNKLYLLGDNNNRIYQCTLSTPWDISTTSYDNIFFNVSEDTDPVNVFFKSNGTKMYIVGEKENRIFQYTLSTPWNISTSTYDNIFFNITQDGNPYGLFFKSNGTKMYIVGDSNNIVYQYSLTN